MKLWILVSALILAGCATKEPAVYIPAKPHYQTNARHPSNLYAEAGNNDSYMWYQRNTSRNLRLGRGYIGSGTTTEGYFGGGKRGAHGGAGPPEMYNGGYGAPGYYGPMPWYPTIY